MNEIKLKVAVSRSKHDTCDKILLQQSLKSLTTLGSLTLLKHGLNLLLLVAFTFLHLPTSGKVCLCLPSRNLECENLFDFLQRLASGFGET